MKILARSILALLLLASFARAPTLAADTHITFITDWKAQAEHGGYYEALALGLYKRRGLDVEIREGGPTVNVPQLLAGGAGDFGIASNSFILINMVRAGIPLTAVMAIFQKDPQVLITHPRRDLDSLADMRGQPILISDAATVTFWPWLKAKYHFNDSQIRKYTFNLAPFLVDPNAIQEGYLTSEPYTVQRQGHFAPRVFLLADYGYPGYANIVMVPRKWIETNPAAVQAFVSATRDGWLHYLNGDPRPANALIKRDNPEMTEALIVQSVAKMKQYGLALAGDSIALGLGSMTDWRWRDFYQTMVKEGIYPRGLDYKKAYDLRFIRDTPQNFH